VLVCGVQRKLSIIQERCEATEAMCKETMAKVEDTQKERSRAGDRIGHIEHQFAKAKTDTATEHAAMKLKIEELSNRINMIRSPQGHGWDEVFRQFRNLDVQMSRLPDTSEQSHPQQQQRQQQRQQDTLKPALQGAANTNPDYLLGRCGSFNSALSPRLHPAKEAHAAAAMDTIETFVRGDADAKLQIMLVHQLPGTGDSSNATNSSEELSCPSEAADVGFKDCELRQVELDLTTPETTASARFSSAPGTCWPTPQTVQHMNYLQARFPFTAPLLQGVRVAQTGAQRPWSPELSKRSAAQEN